MSFSLACRRAPVVLLICLFTLQGGCGVLTFRVPDFDSAETGDLGEIYVLDDLRKIANDPDLSEDQKREAFRELGIEDEDLIEALLTLESLESLE